MPKVVDVKLETLLIEAKCNTELDTLGFNTFNNILKNKKEQKQLRTIHEQMFDVYVDKLTYATQATAKSYSKMISQFIYYSPGIDPADLEPFLASKFNLSKEGGTLKSKLKGNSLKYFNCINCLLQRVYSSEFSKLNPENAKTIKSKFKLATKVPTIVEVMNAYADLMDMKMFQDALILHLIYSIGINPETVVLLTFDSIDENGKMRYFDTMKLKYVDTILNQNFIRDIKFFKDAVLEIKSETKNNFRCFQDKAIVIGEFIFEYTSSAIYNRFARCFGGKLPWFKYTPNQIVKLSESTRVQKKDKNRHYSLNLIEDSIDALKQNLSTN